MNKDTNILKKTVKVAGVTCLALGGAALIASGAALKALTEGGKYLKDTVKKIINDKPVEESAIVEEAEETSSVETAAEATVVVDTSANE